MAFRAPTTQLPPGYSWGPSGVGDHTQVNLPAIFDPSGQRVGGLNAVNGLWDQYNSATGGGLVGSGSTLTLQQLGNIGNVQEGQRLADEGSLTDMQKEYEGIPDSLMNLYTTAAKRGGTYANTGEFNTGLKSEVAQGTRGAQAALGARMAAVYKRLGKPMPTHLQQYENAPDANKVDNAVEAPPTESAPDSSAPSEGATASADQQNAITKTSTTSQTDLQKKLAAMKAASGSL